MKRLLLTFLLLELLLILTLVFAAEPVLAATVDLVNPLEWIGVKEPGELVLVSFKAFAGLIGTIAIAFIVFNGFKLVIAGSVEPGKDQKINAAKRGLLWSVGGFMVAILSFTLISGVAKFLGFDPSRVGTDTIKNPVNIGSETKSGDFIEVLKFVMTNFLGILGFAAIAVIIYYGYMYITSAGNEEATKRAKEGLKWALVGFVVTILAYTIISAIQKLLV